MLQLFCIRLIGRQSRSERDSAISRHMPNSQPPSTYARPQQHAAGTGQARIPFAGVQEPQAPRTDAQPSERACYTEFVSYAHGSTSLT